MTHRPLHAICRYRHCQHHTSSDRTPLARMLPRVIGGPARDRGRVPMPTRIPRRPGSPRFPYGPLFEIAHALPLVLEGTGRADETSPSSVCAFIFGPRINSQRRCSGRIALAVACVGEGDGHGVSAGAETTGVDQREGHSDRGGGGRA
jgi:hypothetical protein